MCTGHEDELLALGARSKRLIQTIQKLETLQIKSTLPSLPKFVVVGDQSAGKSSIIEALCDVTLPRNQGTCTRCPFRITTTAARNSDSWGCKISLQTKYAYDLAAAGTSAFNCWTEQAAEVFEFATIQGRDNLETVLIQAQLAILNPTRDATFYMVAQQPGGRTEVQFSPNVICLDIQGPGLPEMSFTDLPGSINVVEDERDQHLVTFVEQLVKSYLQDEKVLIMLACAADSDIENSTTFRFIRDCKAETRCLGVLTKPDLLPPSRLHHVNRMLEGRAFRLGESWFVTKQLSQTQLDQKLTHARARELERDFFTTGVWARQMTNHASKFGITNLQDAISKKLTQHIITEYVNTPCNVFPSLTIVVFQKSFSVCRTG